MFPTRFLTSFAVTAAALPAMAASAPTPAPAVEAPGLADYQRTVWSAADGAPPRIADMAQTADGWLWLSTTDGLFRFDGLRFERFAIPPLGGLARDRINSVYAAPNGDLYVSYFAEGASVVHPDGRVEHLPLQDSPGKGILVMTLDGEGSLWTVGGAIQRLRAGKWETVEEGPEWRDARTISLLYDGRQLWASTELHAWRFDPARGRFVEAGPGGGALMVAPDGRVWLAGRGHAPRLLGESGRARPASYQHASGRWAGLVDAAGALWTLNCPQPVCLAPDALRDGGIQANEAARHAVQGAVPGPKAETALEDREGNIWVATEDGLERYRRNRLLSAGLAGSGLRYSLGTDGAGRMWAADDDTGILWRLAPGGAPQRQAGGPVQVIANGRDGALLVGHPRSIERRSGAGTDTIALPPGPDGKPRDHVMLGILDDGKVLWTTTLQTGLIGWRDGQWHPARSFNLPRKIYQSAPAGPGQLWLATGDGTLVFYDNDRLTTYDIRAVGLASSIFPGTPLTVSGQSGFGALVDGKLRMLRGADGSAPDALRNITGMVLTPDGDRWLNGAIGLLHVRAADWARSMADPGQPLRYTLLGLGDGYPGRATLDNRWRSALSPDGRHLWLTGTAGVARLDTASLRRNPVAPRAAILNVAAGNTLYPARGAVVLPPGGGQFRIQYTAPALRMPERVRFQVRLDGFDSPWQDAGTRRDAAYTNIGPGDYVFRVRAINEDGVAGAPDATVALRVEPTVTQTLWFKLACAGALFLLAALAYRWRVRYLTGRLTERLRVRTAERERIARTLHDTFLQTVQGLVLRVDAVAARLAPGDPARGQLEHVLEDAGRAIGEGRGQLQELRADDAHVLEDVALDAVTRLRATHGFIEVELVVEGERRALVPAVSEEIAEVLREALRNAFVHAGARRIRVGIVYGRRSLDVTVADDGRGIDEAVRRNGGRDGHYGLAGMRERAARLGARLDIGAAAREGTTLVLAVPAACAYPPGRPDAPWHALLRRRPRG